MKKIFTVLLSLFSIQILNAQTPDHLVITEVAAQPTNGEFIEIHNPTSSPINLSNYYLSDSKNYYNLPATTTAGSGEFIARFPNVEIAAGTYLTIAVNTAEKYFANYGTNPDFKMVSDTTTLVTQMISPFTSAIATNSGLGNSNELVVLFFWDGTSELVKDVDYVFWGSSDTVDKSGVTIGSSTYANDTAVSNQVAISTTVHANGSTWQRYNPPKEFGETLTGGNGITGNNETSETLSASFGVGAPTLKSASTISPPGADGSGTVTVAPNSVPNSANTTLIFTFSGTVTDTVTQLTLDLPTTWVFDGTSAVSSSGTVSATTSQVSVSGTSISAGQNLTLTLSNLTSAANSETSTFTFKTAGTNGTLTAIASQPKVTVFVVDGSGTVTVSPNSVVTSTTTSLTFTLTGTVNATLSKISVDLPAGWVFDGTSAVSSSGTVSATTSQVSVSGASVSLGQTLTVTVSNLVSPSAAGSSVFVCKTAGANGTLTTITGTQPTVAVSLPPGAAIPIAEIRNNFSVYNGQTLTIEAVVTVPFGALRNDRLDLYVQDDSGFGINVYGASGIALADTAKFKRGNKVKIEGKITEYSGTKEIEVSATSVITLVGTGFPLPAPKVFAAPSLVYAEISKWEGTWLQLVGIVDAVATTPAGGGYTINLHGKPSTELFDTRVWEVSGITPGSIFTVGDTVTVTGIGDFFGTKVQIPIASASDVVKGGTFTEPPPQPVSDGAGSAEAGQIFVSKGFTGSLDITFNGAGPDTAGIGQVSLAVPAEVTFTTFTLSGEGFAGATQTTTGNEIKITGATLSEGKKGVISFTNVTFPNEDKILSFVSKSAKTNGTLTATAENPVFIVGIGNAASVAVDSIQKDEEAFNGQTVTVTGIVTFDQGLISTLGETWVQDASGRGINVFSSQINGIKRGTVVTIVGQIENYLSSSAGTSDFKTTELTNLVSVTQHGRVASISSILNEVTLNEVSESSGQNHRFEGTTVKMKVRVTEVPASPVGGGYNVIIVDTLESEITLRVWTSTSINPAEILKVGTTYDMILLVDTYRSDLQMVLGFKNDVKEFIIDTSGYPDFGLRLRYNGVLLHHLSQKFEIEYQVPSSGNTKMRVFDLKGRSVATLLDNFEGGESNVWKNVSWAGTNDAGEPQPMGVYLCHYVFTDYASGKTYKKVIPLVIGTKF